jgi:hypothetical protein
VNAVCAGRSAVELARHWKIRTPYTLWTIGGGTKSVRVVSWNIRQAASAEPKQHAWSYLTALEPDLLLLQEVGAIPEPFRDQYTVLQISTPCCIGWL